MATTIVLPGDKIQSESSCSTIGPGLTTISKNDQKSILVTNCGRIRRRLDGDKNSSSSSSSAAWIDCDNRRYIPTLGDHVVGQVVQKLGIDGFKVEIGSSELANLSSLSFENATKQNRPDVRVGDLVYAQLTQIVEPELVCVSEDRRARSFGVLPADGSGWLIRSTPQHVRRLSATKTCDLFSLLGKKAPYEIACGMNGWIWVKAHTTKQTIFVSRAIEMSRHLDNDRMKELVDRLEKEQLKTF